MVAEIAGETTAQAIQLGLEYNPDPPFDAGHPDCAPDAAKDTVFPRYERARSARFATESLAYQSHKLQRL
jgi:cyclohexyl-isocyanide hydratase